MKPYNTRKPRRTRFNAFPPTIPRWGRHKRRYYSNRTTRRRRSQPEQHAKQTSDPWVGVNNKLHDGWWLSKGDSRSCINLCDFLYMACILPLSVFFLFIMSVGIYIAAAVDFATLAILSVFVYIKNHIIALVAILFTPDPTPPNLFLIAVDVSIATTVKFITLAIQPVLQCFKSLPCYLAMVLTPAPPPSNYLRMKYTTPLHKILCVFWFRQFSWAASAESDAEFSGDEDEKLEQQMDKETDDVMKERVAKSTRGGYDSRNVSFMVWYFDRGEKYRYLFNPNLLPILRDADLKDKQRTTKKGKPSKKRDHLRAACQEALTNINAEQPETIPINLEQLDFKVFTRYLSTFKKTVKKRNSEGDFEVDVDEKNKIRLSPSSYDGACSALSHLFLESGIDKENTITSKELWTKISSFKKGTRRLAVKEKKAFGLATIEGKKPLPFRAYKYLAKILFESSKPEHVAAHTFLLLEWNLISRAEYVVSAKIDAISCQEDAILFDIGKTKTDQEGTRNVDHPWHVYSNPEDPYICCFVAMARHLMGNPNILSGKAALFEGSNQYDRFNRIFLDIVSDPKYRDTFVSFGIPPEHFGTHSIRKGAVTHIATGTTSCPPIASICLRANWAMPGVMNRYIRFENAGDQFVGKCVSGRSRLSKDFAASPAYYDFSSCDKVMKDQNEKAINKWIKDRMPESAKSNEDVFALFKMCIASLEHNRSFLEKNLHSQSNVRASIFMIESSSLGEYVTVKYPWNKTDDTPEISGIPPDVLVLAEFEGMKNQLKEMQSSMESNFQTMVRRELDDREVGGAAYSKVSEMMNKMDRMMEIFKSQAVSLSSPLEEPINYCVGGFDIEDEEDTEIVIPILSESTADQLAQERTKKKLMERKFTIGFHHGKLNPLPSTWRYPKGITLIHLINLWLIGQKDDNVPPMRKWSPQYVSHFDHNGRNYSKFKQVMKFVEEFGRLKGVWVGPNEWDGETITKLWSAIWKDFDPYMRTETMRMKDNAKTATYHKSRNGQVACTTIHSKLSQAGKLKGNKPRKRQKTNNPVIDNIVEKRKMKVLAAKHEEEREAQERASQLADILLGSLTSHEKKAVHGAIHGPGVTTDVLATQASDSVNRASMRTLQPTKWLNDEIINFYLKHCLAKRDEQLCAKQSGRKRSHFFNSFFLQNLFDEKSNDVSKRGKYNYDNARRWSSNVPGNDVFQLKYIVCPYNLDNYHWAAAVIFMEDKRIQWYDSKMGLTKSTEKNKLNGLMQYLKDEYRGKGCGELDDSEWNLVPCTKITPQQRNGKRFSIVASCCHTDLK